MQVIEALNTLWITLPLKGVADERGTLEAYGFALEPFSIDAIQNTINSLRRGEIEEASKTWCPRPPELAAFVRVEQKRLDALNRKPAVSYMPASTGFKDWSIIQRQTTDELQAKGYYLVKKDVTIDEFNNVGRRKRWQIGALWFWQLQEVWAPIGAAYPSTGAVLQPKQEAA